MIHNITIPFAIFSNVTMSDWTWTNGFNLQGWAIFSNEYAIYGPSLMDGFFVGILMMPIISLIYKTIKWIYRGMTSFHDP